MARDDTVGGLMGYRRLATLFVVGWLCTGHTVEANSGSDAASAPQPGMVEGVVTDPAGAPQDGVLVSVLGVGTAALAVTDAQGHYSFEGLRPGPYFIRAYRDGFVASQRHMFELLPDVGTVVDFELRRIASEGGTPSVTPASLVAPAGEPLAAARPITVSLIGGEADPQADEGGEVPAGEDADSESHPHDELAWRLRHSRRSILRDVAAGYVVEEEAPQTAAQALLPQTVTVLGRAVESSARFAADWLNYSEMSGQLNLLTSGSFDRAADLFSTSSRVRGVAHVAVDVPQGERGQWAVQGGLTEGDVSSWTIGGSYLSNADSTHRLDLGMSFSTQQYQGVNTAALSPGGGSGHRSVRALHAYDDWAVSKRLTVHYGAGLANYDYLDRANLFSPRLGVVVAVAEGTRVRTLASQGMRAPGGEEFLPPARSRVWLPPERTFSPLVSQAAFRAERSRHLEVALEHEFAGAYVVGLRRFYQGVDDQLVTLFGAAGPNPSHYYVANAGNVDSDGWGVSVSRLLVGRVRGVVDYSFTRAAWRPSQDAQVIADYASSAVRTGREDFHDVTTSVQTEIPETATRVFVVYRINTAYARSVDESASPGLDGRFDVRVEQRLPFLPFERSDWEVMVAVRNLFRGPLEAARVAYDELLAVRPPKRFVGGLMVRF